MALDFPNSPTNGEAYEGFVWDSTAEVWRVNKRTTTAFADFQYLVIGGGGGGGRGVNGTSSGGGGGAGGYRTNAGTSGGGASAEADLILATGSYTVTVGDGGAERANGSPSFFAEIVSLGGGYGGDGSGVGSGASGGGGKNNSGPVGSAFVRQGFDGGSPSTGQAGGGGGGGSEGNPGGDGIGGNGVASAITGSSVLRGGGGGGNGQNGGTGGGGNGSSGGAGFAATANTGGGGGGGISSGNAAGGAGGSGIVIVKYPDWITLTIGASLTSSTATAGGYKITSFTAGTDTVSF